MSLFIENLEYKALALIENYNCSDMTEDYTLEEYVQYSAEEDPDFLYWLLRPFTEEEEEELENLSCHEEESFINEIIRECLNQYN